SQEDLCFRNLGGTATQHEPVGPGIGTLTTTVKLTNVSRSAGMIIQNFDFHVTAAGRPIYSGQTAFGFFSKAALQQQVGIRDATPFEPPAEQRGRALSFLMPDDAPYPEPMLRMIDDIDLFIPDGGSCGLGFIRGTKRVNPEEWFFKAHFF